MHPCPKMAEVNPYCNYETQSWSNCKFKVLLREKEHFPYDFILTMNIGVKNLSQDFSWNGFQMLTDKLKQTLYSYVMLPDGALCLHFTHHIFYQKPTVCDHMRNVTDLICKS